MPSGDQTGERFSAPSWVRWTSRPSSSRTRTETERPITAEWQKPSQSWSPFQSQPLRRPSPPVVVTVRGRSPLSHVERPRLWKQNSFIPLTCPQEAPAHKTYHCQRKDEKQWQDDAPRHGRKIISYRPTELLESRLEMVEKIAPHTTPIVRSQNRRGAQYLSAYRRVVATNVALRL